MDILKTKTCAKGLPCHTSLTTLSFPNYKFESYQQHNICPVSVLSSKDAMDFIFLNCRNRSVKKGTKKKKYGQNKMWQLESKNI